MNDGDNPPIGIVLCADKSESVVKYTLPENETQIFASKLNILVTGNLDSGILETDIPEDGNSLIGLFTTYQVVRYCQAQSRFAVL